MTYLKISIPIYRKEKWERLEKDGKLEVSSDADNLSDCYEALKQQLDNLLSELDAQCRLAENAESLEREIQQQSYVLKTLLKDIDRATAHYEDLKFFLRSWGVDPSAYALTFDKRVLLEAESVSRVEQVPPDPIHPDDVI